ncbi:MAG TPA: AI-2E family transporter [Prolixibacteraceae bacterium]|nr:AI-2E family transporter [Prolixibacteraceae bacterium]
MFNLKGRTKSILLITGGIITFFLFWFFSNIVSYILLSLILSFMGRPLMKVFDRIRFRKMKVPKSLAAFITLLTLWLVFIGCFRFLVPLLVKEFETFSSIDFGKIMNSLKDPLSRFFTFFSRKPVEITDTTFIDIISDQLNSKLSFSDLPNMVSFMANTLIDLFIGFFAVSFITFFFLREEKMFRDAVLLLVPTEMEAKVKKILSTISLLLQRYFLGIALEMLVVGTLYTVGLTIVGIGFNHAVIISLFAALFNIIPYVGPWMGAMLGMLAGMALNVDLDFMQHTLPLIGWMGLVFLIVKTLDDILFQPLIYSSSVKAHPLEIFLIILAAGSIAGIKGMILAIPVYTILRVIAKEFFDNLKFVRKITEDLDKFEKEENSFSQ